ncbi:FG-GAP repeat domain-containing protein [Streptomyces omiyaensis]|uniref:FG-GAP repeat domain-containing protein n=1 Tax=Streptomyces omiyaensis TaxID=68247 RepID=UPI0036FEFB2A
MTPPHPARRRLAGSVAAVLATALGAGALAGAPAATAAVSAAQEADAPAAFAPGHWVLGGGKEGFFSVDGRSYGNQDPTFGRLAWTRYADNARTEYDMIGTDSLPVVSGDLGAVIRFDERSVLLVDAAGGTSTTVPLDAHTYTVDPLGIAGGGLLAHTGPVVKHYTARGVRVVSGLPGNHAHPTLRAVTDSHAVILTEDGGAAVWAVVDLAAAEVVRTHRVPAGADPGSVALSDTRIAWVEYRPDGTARAAVRERSGDATTHVELGAAPDKRVQVQLIGDWLTYGRPGGLDATTPSPLHALHARRLTGDRATVRLLDHFETERVFGDRNPPSPVLRGGSLAAGDGGEGVHRIVLGADGVPKAVLEATTGGSTAVRALSAVLPHQGGTLRPDAVPGGAPTRFAFTLNRCNVKVEAVLRHSSGATLRRTWNATEHADIADPCAGQPVAFDWRHHLDAGTDGHATGAPEGAYTAAFTFTPLNGVGPAGRVTGSFTVERAEGPHDFDRNSDPDFFARDAAGVLWTDSTVMLPRQELNAPTRRIGGGWQAYDRIEGAGRQTLVARDRTGTLWYYPGDGRGGTGARKAVGGGWQVYDEIAGGSDLTGDGRADLLATDGAGVLWLYRATGSATRPFDTRRRIGTGWGAYDQLAGVGDVAGAPAGDLIARDGDGRLWLYLGKGDGTFTGRTLVGGGWSAYTALAGGGDADHDGRNDLFAWDARQRKTFFYGGTGDRARPFEGRRATTVLGGRAYGHFA